MKKGRRPLTVRHLLIMLAEINARYDALILDARLRRSPEVGYWEREKEKFGREVMRSQAPRGGITEDRA